MERTSTAPANTSTRTGEEHASPAERQAAQQGQPQHPL